MIPLLVFLAILIGAVPVAFGIHKLTNYMDKRAVPDKWVITAAVATALAYGAIGATLIMAVIL